MENFSYFKLSWFYIANEQRLYVCSSGFGQGWEGKRNGTRRYQSQKVDFGVDALRERKASHTYSSIKPVVLKLKVTLIRKKSSSLKLSIYKRDLEHWTTFRISTTSGWNQ